MRRRTKSSEAADSADRQRFIERDILIGLIVSGEYLACVTDFWCQDLLEAKLARLVSRWCLRYFGKYRKAPKHHIESYFNDHRRWQLDDDSAEQVQLLLQSLSNEYEWDGRAINVDYLVDRTRRYFCEQAQRRYIEQYRTHVERGEFDEAASLTPPQLDFGDLPAEVITGRDVKRVQVKWLEQHVLPCGYLTILGGRKSTGKSQRMLKWAADLSHGLLNSGHTPIADTLYISVEDTPGDSIMPRYDVAGGDDSRIHLVQGVQGGIATRQDHGETVLDLWNVQNVRKLHEWLDTYPDVRLVCVDSIGAFMPVQKRQGSGYSHAYQALAPLANLARERGVAIVLSTHLRKGYEGQALEQIIDSTAITGLARMVQIMGRDPADPDNPKRGIFVVSETNLTPKRVSLSYRMESLEVDPAVGSHPLLVFNGKSAVTANELVAKPKKPEDRLQLEETQDWVREQLAANGPVLSTELYNLGKREEGLSADQIRSALHKIGAKRRKLGFQGKWAWELPKRLRRRKN